MRDVAELIDEIIRVEGGYSDNPNDSGGKTKYGITEKVARANGYTGDMRDLHIELARGIYYRRYVVEPGFDKVMLLSPVIAAELVDTGVNMGPAVAGKFLQSALNAFNQRGTLWPDLVVDGGVGQKTISALASHLRKRGERDGVRVLLVALNALQGARYIELSQMGEHKNEDFVFGWMLNRVTNQVVV